MSSTLGAGTLGAGAVLAAGFASCPETIEGQPRVKIMSARETAASRTHRTVLLPASLVKRILRSRDFAVYFPGVATAGFVASFACTAGVTPKAVNLAFAKAIRQGYVSLCHWVAWR